MARKKSDSAILAEIREVIADVNRDFEVICHKTNREAGLEKGQVDPFRESYAMEVIEDILNGEAGLMTQDYRKTKADAAKAAKAVTPAP